MDFSYYKNTVFIILMYRTPCIFTFKMKTNNINIHILNNNSLMVVLYLLHSMNQLFIQEHWPLAFYI